MATAIKQLSTNLGLPEVPLVKDSQLFIEFLRVYNAIRALAAKVDLVSGQTAYSDEEKLAVKANSTVLVGNQAFLYAECAVDVVAGNTVDFDATGKLILGTATTVKGVALEEKLTSEVCKVLLLGLLPITSATPGIVYYADTTTPGLISTSGSQVIGYGLPGGSIFFSPI